MSMQLTTMVNLNKGYSKFLSSVLGGTSSALRNITATTNALTVLDRSIMAINRNKVKKPNSNIVDVKYKEVPPVNLTKGYSKFLDSVLGKTGSVIRSITTTTNAIAILDKSIRAINGSKVKKSNSNIIDVDYKEVPSTIDKKQAVDKEKERDKQTPKKGNGLLKYAQGLASVDNLIKGMNLADEYMGIYAKINLMNNGLESTDELQNKIFASANRSRTSYNDMASSITQMSASASGAFSNNDELIAFTELAQKSFKLGGAGTEEQTAGMGQLTQAMSSGSIGEDQLGGIMDSAPKIAEAISTYTGKSKEELRSMAAEGSITSDTIKNAMFAMSKDINSDFGLMPKKFGDIWTQIKNTALQALDPVIKKFADLISSNGFQSLVGIVCSGINMIAQGLSWIVQGITLIGQSISDNWSIIQPILMAIAMVMLPMLIQKIILATIELYKMIAPILIQAVAWMAANIPLILLVLAIAAVIFALGQMGVTFEQICGYIVGSVYTMISHFKNAFILAWNVTADFVNFLANVFNSPISSIGVLFFELADTILGAVEKAASGIEFLLNAIPGVEVEITNGLTSLRGEVQKQSKAIKDKVGFKEVIKKKEYIDPSDEFSKGYKVGNNAGTAMSSSVGTFIDKIGFSTDSLKPDFDVPTFSGTPTLPEEMGVTNVGGQPLDVAINQDDIKYIQDLAERDYIARFGTATLAPNITVSFGDIHETVDANQVMGHVERILREEIAMVAEG